MQKVAAVILAAGQGKRMKSSVPKVLHKAAGLPLAAHVVAAVKEAGISEIIIVYGETTSSLKNVLGGACSYIIQEEPLGTGDAVRRAFSAFSPGIEEVLVLCGDTPLLRGETLRELVNSRRAAGAEAALLTTIFDDASGYGRVIRQQGMVLEIVEELDATPEQRQIREINTGTYAFRRQALEENVARLRPDNEQQEYYLTDCIGMLRAAGCLVAAITAPAAETAGVNTRKDLAKAEKILRKRQCERLLAAGVTIIDPDTTYIDAEAEVGRDTVIYPFTFLEGKTRVGECCVLGPGTRLVEVSIGNEVEVQYSVVLRSIVGDKCVIGPYAYIRPETVLAEGVKIGDFVELKKVVVGTGSKIPHLSYIGDAVVGSSVNIGAGTITCNYDGINKHLTCIEDGSFIGSNANLVAPVTIGENSTVGAGSTVTKDVPSGALAVERARQVNIDNWLGKKYLKKR